MAAGGALPVIFEQYNWILKFASSLPTYRFSTYSNRKNTCRNPEIACCIRKHFGASC